MTEIQVVSINQLPAVLLWINLSCWNKTSQCRIKLNILLKNIFNLFLIYHLSYFFGLYPCLTLKIAFINEVQDINLRNRLSPEEGLTEQPLIKPLINALYKKKLNVRQK